MRKALPIALLLWLIGLMPAGAADINATLVKADVSVYEKLLKPLESEANATGNTATGSTDERTLQITLLERLISLAQNPPVFQKIPTTVPADEQEYRLRFGQYESWLDAKARLLKQLKSLESKVQAFKDRLDVIVPTQKNRSRIQTLQLQFAYYRRKQLTSQAKLDHYQQAIDATPKLFVKALKTIRLDDTNAVKRLKQIRETLADLEKKIQQLEILKERDDLLGKNADSQKVSTEIKSLKLGQRSLHQNEIMELYIRFSSALKAKQEKEVFALEHRIMTLAPQAFDETSIPDLSKLLEKMEKAFLGQVGTLKGATLQEIQNVTDSLWKELNRPLFSINDTPISAFKLIVAILIFVFSIILGALYKKSIQKLSFRSRTITPSTQTLLSNLGFYLIVLIAFFTILKFLGINLSSIALIAGALSVGIGFGLQTIVSNFVSGLILMFERSIKIGDYLELGEDLRGHVSDIRMRSTTITTNDNIDVIVPNQDLIQNRVINWTMKDQICRFRIPFGVAYGTDVDKVERVILEAVKQSGFDDIYRDKKRHERVVMTGMGDSSVDFDLYVWIKGGEIHYPRRTISRFLKLIYKALYAHGIEIPFPQRDLHLRSSDIPLTLQIQKVEEGKGS